MKRLFANSSLVGITDPKLKRYQHPYTSYINQPIINNIEYKSFANVIIKFSVSTISYGGRQPDLCTDQ